MDFLVNQIGSLKAINFLISLVQVFWEFVNHVQHNRTNSSDNVSKNRIFGLNKEN